MQPSPMAETSKAPSLREITLQRHSWRVGAVQPRTAFPVQSFHRRAAQSWQVSFHVEPDLRLQIRKVPVAFRKSCETLRIERQGGGRIHRIHAVLLVNGLPAHDSPSCLPFLEEVEEATGADDVNEDV